MTLETYSHFYRKQTGSALVFSLIILLALTILGLTSTATSFTETKMVVSLSDRQISFQAAEAVMRAAESAIENQVSTAAFNGSNGFYGLDDTEPTYTSTWTSSNSASYGHTISGVAAQPRYRIKIMSEVANPDHTANVGRYGQSKKQDPITIFRITVQGIGKTAESVTYLRSYYGKKF
jgi:type IV pilus assembly protein PilX